MSCNHKKKRRGTKTILLSCLNLNSNRVMGGRFWRSPVPEWFPSIRSLPVHIKGPQHQQIVGQTCEQKQLGQSKTKMIQAASFSAAAPEQSTMISPSLYCVWSTVSPTTTSTTKTRQFRDPCNARGNINCDLLNPVKRKGLAFVSTTILGK